MADTATRNWLIGLLVCATAFSPFLMAQSAKDINPNMAQDARRYGKLNPKAPAELGRWTFLVGEWSGQAKLKREGARIETLQVSWNGRYILDGYAIADDYRMTSAAGELIVLGTNIRAYDAQKKIWNMKWLNALTGTWVDLGTQELGGWRVDEKSFWYIVKESPTDPALTRATYTNISANHFIWTGESSQDGKSWKEFLSVDLHRGAK